jgi:glycosyltransferase involved in cell wall biosynthesis
MLLYITYEEGLGSAALLAMAAGLPVVASRVGGLPEAVEDGVTGLLVDNSPGSIVAAMRRLLDAPAEARRMGLAGRERVAARFTVEIMVEKTLAVYRKVLA